MKQLYANVYSIKHSDLSVAQRDRVLKHCEDAGRDIKYLTMVCIDNDLLLIETHPMYKFYKYVVDAFMQGVTLDEAVKLLPSFEKDINFIAGCLLSVANIDLARNQDFILDLSGKEKIRDECRETT